VLYNISRNHDDNIMKVSKNHDDNMWARIVVHAIIDDIVEE
jgi:hypothetical protein